MKRNAALNLAVDFGEGREAAVEMEGEDALWAAAGPGISKVDLWLKASARMIDLRLRVRRIGDSIDVAIDRGDEPKPWWSTEGVPRLAITVDLSRGQATAIAGVGQGAEFQQVMLGQTDI
jgi:hypothetical protein